MPQHEFPPITPNTGAIQSAQGQVEAWRASVFAPAWLEDTAKEAQQDGRDARRREVVFAVCFTESYLYEMVRDQVLPGQPREITRYFPVTKEERKPGIKKRCRKVFTALCQDHKIAQSIDWDSASWTQFEDLVDMRDGLVHASISRPDTASLPEEARPNPNPEHLDKLPRGWALKIVLDLVKTMHAAIGHEPPFWIVKAAAP